MLITTTHTIEGRRIVEYKGVVSGQVISGAHVGRDVLAKLTDFVGGRSTSYEKVLRKAFDAALEEVEGEAEMRGANAVVGVGVDYEAIHVKGTMLMAVATGTAVVLENAQATDSEG